MFLSMLGVYSYYVLTSIHTKYYVQDRAKFYEYYVIICSYGDGINEGIIIYVSFCIIVFRTRV